MLNALTIDVEDYFHRPGLRDPGGKRVGWSSAADLFGGSLPAGTVSLRVEASGPILGLELFGDPQGASLAGRSLGTPE